MSNYDQNHKQEFKQDVNQQINNIHYIEQQIVRKQMLPMLEGMAETINNIDIGLKDIANFLTQIKEDTFQLTQNNKN